MKWSRAFGVTGVEVSTSISRPFKPSLQTSAATSWLISLTWSNSNTCRRMQFLAAEREDFKIKHSRGYCRTQRLTYIYRSCSRNAGLLNKIMSGQQRMDKTHLDKNIKYKKIHKVIRSVKLKL